MTPDQHTDSQLLLERADRQLYHAKENGRNRIESETITYMKIVNMESEVKAGSRR